MQIENISRLSHFAIDGWPPRLLETLNGYPYNPPDASASGLTNCLDSICIKSRQSLYIYNIFSVRYDLLQSRRTHSSCPRSILHFSR